MDILKYPEKGRISPEGVVVEWNRQEGDSVQTGDGLMHIEAAGQMLEMESPADGLLLKITANVGSPVALGQSLAVIGREGDDISQVLEKISNEKPSPAKPLAAQAKPKPARSVSPPQPAPAPTAESQIAPAAKPAAQKTETEEPILMPQAGQSMEEGTILSWKVSEGDLVEVGQVLMEIETDKATIEVEAEKPGRITKIVAPAGKIVSVREPVAYIARQGEPGTARIAQAPAPETPAQTSAAPKTAAPSSQQPTPQAGSVSEGEIVPILMPQAGQSMEEGTILSWKVSVGDPVKVGQVLMEIETDKATVEVEADKAGIITEIVAAEGQIVQIREPVAYLKEEKTGAPAPTAAQAAPVQAAPAQPAPAPVDRGNMNVLPLTKMRRAIAKNLLLSKQTIPHFYAKKTIDAGLLFTAYRKTKERFKCSINDFVTMACAKAIRQYPAFRSQYRDTEIHENPAVNIGIAVGTNEGLTVPVVLNADQMNLEQLAAQTRHVVESARNGKLEGFGQGVFTITNLGMFGCDEFSAIINPPESAILAVGAIVEGVKVENEKFHPTRLMTMSLSVDHRVVDGVLAAQFLNTLQELLENPEQLVS